MYAPGHSFFSPPRCPEDFRVSPISTLCGFLIFFRISRVGQALRPKSPPDRPTTLLVSLGPSRSVITGTIFLPSEGPRFLCIGVARKTFDFSRGATRSGCTRVWISFPPFRTKKLVPSVCLPYRLQSPRSGYPPPLKDYSQV